MRQIQSFAAGLTAALQLKGQEPLQFLAEVQGGVDMLPWIIAARRTQERSNAPVTSTAASATVEVPDGEVWLVERATAYIQADAANDVLQCALRFDPRGSNPFFTLAISGPPQAQPGSSGRFFRAGEEAAAIFSPASPFIAFAGDAFVAAVPVVSSTGTPQLFLDVQVARFGN